MAVGWIRFWKGESWRSWRGERREWTGYKTDSKDLREQQAKFGEDVRRSEQERADAGDALVWSSVSEQDVPIKTAKGESGLASVHGVRLMELRGEQGEKQWIMSVDQGSVYFTDRKMVFSRFKRCPVPLRQH